MTSLRISVVVAAFNAETTIRATLESLIRQTVEPFEIIVVDDGSTDRTADIVRSIGHRAVRLIQQPNGGQSAALNSGAAAAQGDYIKFVDADDLLNSTHLSSQLSVLRDTEGHVASCRWGYFIGDSRPHVRNEHTYRDYDDPLEWIVDSLTLDEGMMGGWMWLIPRRAWERSGGWNEHLSLNNDFDFTIRLLLASSGVRFGADAVYAYRKGVSAPLSGERNSRAMESAFETTKLGCAALLQRENSPRIRRICADRWQWWLYQFYPEHPNLVEQAEQAISELGGSDVALQGGVAMSLLRPILGWKRVRDIQTVVHKGPWKHVLRWKQRSQHQPTQSEKL